MSILLAPRDDSAEELVYTGDKEVTTAKGSPRGWIPRRDAQAVRGGATVVAISPLGPDDDARCTDSGGLAQQALARVRAGLRSVNGDKSDEARERFIDLCPRDPRFLLGVAIRALTDAEDIGEAQEVLFRGAYGVGRRAESEEGEAESGEGSEVEA